MFFMPGEWHATKEQKRAMYRYALSFIWASPTEPLLAAGRNMPTGFAKALQDARLGLRTIDSLEVRPVEHDEMAHIRSGLRKVTTRVPRTHFPCANPLFRELRAHFEKK